LSPTRPGTMRAGPSSATGGPTTSARYRPRGAPRPTMANRRCRTGRIPDSGMESPPASRAVHQHGTVERLPLWSPSKSLPTIWALPGPPRRETAGNRPGAATVPARDDGAPPPAAAQVDSRNILICPAPRAAIAGRCQHAFSRTGTPPSSNEPGDHPALRPTRAKQVEVLAASHGKFSGMTRYSMIRTKMKD